MARPTAAAQATREYSNSKANQPVVNPLPQVGEQCPMIIEGFPITAAGDDCRRPNSYLGDIVLAIPAFFST